MAEEDALGDGGRRAAAPTVPIGLMPLPSHVPARAAQHGGAGEAAVVSVKHPAVDLSSVTDHYPPAVELVSRCRSKRAPRRLPSSRT